MTRPPRLLFPPFAFAICVIGMLLLHYFAPGPKWVFPPWNFIGAAIALAGLALGGSGARLFRRRKTGVVPFSPATELVTDGPYRFTRNPMYVGLATILVGLAIWFGDATPPIVIPVFVWWITAGFIVNEERFLVTTFGQPYEEYRRRVRRWL